MPFNVNTSPQGAALSDQLMISDMAAAEAEQFRILIESVTDYAIYMLDASGYVSTWNTGAERIKGYRREEILGQHFSRFYTEEDRARNEPARTLEEAAREGRVEREGWRVRKDGSRFRANVVVDAIHDAAGRLIGFAKITRDITERAETQAALEQAREALFQSQKLEAIGQLTSGVAHDFNNLLTAVLSSLELLRRRLPDDPRSLQLLDNAVLAAQRGSGLTQHLLAFARRQSLATEVIDVGERIGGMRGLLAQALGPLVALDLRLPPDLPPVLADPNQLELAVLNIAVNARDAMPDGGPLVIAAQGETIGGDHETGLPPGPYLRLAIIDSGEGMDAETLTRAVEPFFTTKGTGKGTGLGLSMVQGMAAQLGGRLLLRSAPGEGTTAEVWLPVAKERGRPVRAASEPVPETVAGLTILAVDDDPLVLMNTVAILEDLGHRVVQANSARKALNIIGEGRGVDLVITDQAMPAMTGLQLVAAIRKERPELPAILATGYAELPPGAAAEFVKLDKPFREAELERAIAVAMARAEVPAGAG
jgi:PAS domain S-box-containing protein